MAGDPVQANKSPSRGFIPTTGGKCAAPASNLVRVLRASQTVVSNTVRQLETLAGGTPMAFTIEFHSNGVVAKIASFAVPIEKQGGGGGEGRGGPNRTAETPRGRPVCGGSPAPRPRARLDNDGYPQQTRNHGASRSQNWRAGAAGGKALSPTSPAPAPKSTTCPSRAAAPIADRAPTPAPQQASEEKSSSPSTTVQAQSGARDPSFDKGTRAPARETRSGDKVKNLASAADVPRSVAQQYLQQFGHDVAKAQEALIKETADAAMCLTEELGKAQGGRNSKSIENMIDFLTQVNRANLVVEAIYGSMT